MGYSLETREEIKSFISNMESEIYSGTNVNGENIIVEVTKGEGMQIKTCRKTKPKWWEVIEYDKDGFQISISYEY